MSLTKISKLVCFVLVVCSIIGIPIIIYIDKLMEAYHILNLNNDRFFFTVWFLRICGVIGEYVVFTLLKIFRTISKGNPFVKSNEFDLKVIAIVSFVYAILFAVKAYFYCTAVTIGIIILSLGMSVCAYVFSQLFKQSVQYKEESDFLI